MKIAYIGVMTRTIAALSAAALIAAPGFALPNQVTARTYSDRMMGLTEIQRFAALRRAILDFGEPCKKVLAAGYQGPWKNLEMWVVRCAQPTTDYGAFIGPDGSVQVSTCAEIVKIKLPACRKL